MQPMTRLVRQRKSTILLLTTCCWLCLAVGDAKPLHMSSMLVTEFFDKRIPDEETVLTEIDFEKVAKRRPKRQQSFMGPPTPVEESDDFPPSLHISIMPNVNGGAAVYPPINDSAMYNRNRFEGDIVNPGLTSKTLSGFVEDANIEFFNRNAFTKSSDGGETEGEKRGSLMKNAVRHTYLKWPNGRIPYTISKQYTSNGRLRIAEAIHEYKEKTCVEFTPKTATDLDYVHILPDDGCYSLVGKVGGKQPVSLGNGCMQKGIIIHELMHAVGFFHEQSRADRDNWVKVKWENVEVGLEDQFDKYSLTMIDHLGTHYDYGSVMHYGPTAFTKNGLPTIEPLHPGIQIGQRIGFSATDLYKINKLYGCPNVESVEPSSAIALAAGGGSISTSINIVAPPSPCMDLRPDCEDLVNLGHCDSILYSAQMAESCARSCEKCGAGGSTEECRDRRTWCPNWASSGMCNFYVFQSYMHRKCSLSCGVCKTSAAAAQSGLAAK